jgi:heme-degrading monooxygenase HmoA
MANQAETEVTLVNLFTVEPEKQQSAATKVAEIYRTIVSQQPGFISAKVHMSLDGAKVVAIALWQPEAALNAMKQTSEFHNSLTSLQGEIISAEPHSFKAMYTVGKDAM